MESVFPAFLGDGILREMIFYMEFLHAGGKSTRLHRRSNTWAANRIGRRCGREIVTSYMPSERY